MTEIIMFVNKAHLKKMRHSSKYVSVLVNDEDLKE